jgi:hypothetical protein
MMSCSLNHLLSDAVHSHSAILRFHQLVVNFCAGNALRSIKTGSHYDFLFLFFSLTYVPRSFPLHINLSPQWDPTDFCAICCILSLLQVLRASANQITTIPVVNEQTFINVSGVWRCSAIFGIIRAIVREVSRFSSVPVWNCRYMNSY